MVRAGEGSITRLQRFLWPLVGAARAGMHAVAVGGAMSWSRLAGGMSLEIAAKNTGIVRSFLRPTPRVALRSAVRSTVENATLRNDVTLGLSTNSWASLCRFLLSRALSWCRFAANALSDIRIG